MKCIHSFSRVWIALGVVCIILLPSLFVFATRPVSANVGTCAVFPANNVWNMRVDSLPLHANSANYIASMGNNGLHSDFGSGTWNGGPIGIPFNTVTNAQAKVTIHYTEYGNESDAGPFPIPPNALREYGSDHHVLVVNTSDCMLYELYHASPNADGSWNAGSGAKWSLNSNALRTDTWTSADAAGLPILPGLVRYDEVAAGAINHALRFTLDCTNGYIWPARHQAPSGSCTHPAPMGLRVRLKASKDISSFSARNQVILTALKQYGMIVADNGSDWFVSGTPNENWDNADLHEMQNNIHGSDFEVVDESGWIVDPNSGQAGGTNPTNTPTRTASPTRTRTPTTTRTATPTPTAIAPSPTPDPNQPPMLGGCALFPADSVFNTPIDTLPVDANSDAYINSIGADIGAHPYFGAGLWEGHPVGIPFNIVPKSQPLLPVKFFYVDQSDKGPYPIPSSPKIESNTDRHMLIVQKRKCYLYELYAARKTKTGAWKAGSGSIWDLRSNALRPAVWTSADAAGLPMLPLLVRYNEVAAGEIKHALRFTASATRGEFIWPARHESSDITDPNVPPMGQRFRLKASFDVSGFSPQTRVILNAMKKYGMFLADNGSSWSITGEPNAAWNNDALVNELLQVKGSDFEAVDESSLMVHPDSGQVK